MDNSNNYKLFFKNNLILITIFLFAVIYIIINFHIIMNGELFNGNYIKSILITAIIILIVYIYSTWDDDDKQIDEISPIPKFKLKDINKSIDINKSNIVENKNIGKNKYLIANKSASNNLEKLEDTNIFISQKKLNKFGIKF